MRSTKERLYCVADRVLMASGLNLDVELVDDIAGATIQAQAVSDDDTLFFTEKLVDLLRDDELAWVMAHEVAHVEGRHGERSRERASQFSKDIGKGRGEYLEELRGEDVSLVGRFVKGFLYTAALSAVAYVAMNLHNQSYESEADARALELMELAGYDPGAAVGAVEKLHGGNLSGYSDDGFVLGVLRSLTVKHPSSRTRAKRIERKLEDQD